MECCLPVADRDYWLSTFMDTKFYHPNTPILQYAVCLNHDNFNILLIKYDIIPRLSLLVLLFLHSVTYAVKWINNRGCNISEMRTNPSKVA